MIALLVCSTGFQPVPRTVPARVETRATSAALRLRGHPLNFRDRRHAGKNFSDPIVAKRVCTRTCCFVLNLTRRRAIRDQLTDRLIDDQQLEHPKSPAITGVATRG